MISEAEREEGLLAYEQVLAFAALRRKRLPWVYALFTLLLALAGAAFLLTRYFFVGAGWLAVALAFAVFSVWNWRRLQALDGRNRALLERLRAQYGEDLPWLRSGAPAGGLGETASGSRRYLQPGRKGRQTRQARLNSRFGPCWELPFLRNFCPGGKNWLP